MKKLFAILLALLLCLSLSSCGDVSEEATSEVQEETTKQAASQSTPVAENSSPVELPAAEATNNPNKGDGSWAIYWYLCGSDLETRGGFASIDLLEAMEVTLPDNVTVVIQTGGSKEWHTEGISADKIQRWVMKGNTISLVDETESQSMGDAQTLADFLSFAYANYPADKIGVTFWNHGGGSTAGAAYDEIYENDYLNMVEMYQAFTSVWQPDAENQPLELVGFDTCLMATIDTAYTFCDLAHYLVASEELEPGNGWYYTGWLSALAQNTAMNGEELGKVICDSYYEGCVQAGTEAEVTLSVTDLSKVGSLIEAYNSFGDEALVYSTENPEFLASFARAALKSENYGGNTKEQGYSNMVDIGHLSRLTTDLLPSAANVIKSLDECVSYRVAGPYRSEATGLSAYYSYDGEIEGLNGYILNGVSKSFKYLYAYELTGELIEGGEEYIKTLDIEKMPELVTINDTDWENKLLDLDDDGCSVLDLGPDAVNILSDIQFSLFYTEEENDLLLYLGSDNDIIADWEKGIFKDNFRGQWAALNDIPLYVELSFAGDDYNLYSSPILLNGEEYSLQFAYDFSLEEWYILGATPGIDENGMGSKEVRLLENGDEIGIVWQMSSFDDDAELEMYEVETIVVDDNLTLKETALPDGSYVMVFTMYDAFGNDACSDGVVFDVLDGEITTTVF